MNIVFLNLAVMPYHVAVFKALIQKGCRCVVYWYGKAPKTDYRAPEIDGLKQYDRFEFEDSKALFEHSRRFTPEIVVASGWIDKDYNKVCTLYRNINIPTISMSDTQWHGGKQWFNRLLSSFRHKRYFDYIWGAGVLQFEYARKLGFKADQILLNCFSANREVFSKVSIDKKEKSYPKRFLFVGRFVSVKAIDILLEAWTDIRDKNGWTLELIGDGSLKDSYRQRYGSDVLIKEFMSQEELAKEAELSGCFVIPSRFEPWALVIHEFAYAGLPIIASDSCGATRHFVLNGYNGYTVKSNDVESLKSSIINIMNAPEEELVRFSRNSRHLAETVTPELVADTLLSVFKNKN